MASSVPRPYHPLLFLSLLVLVPLAFAEPDGPPEPPTYHGGALLSGDLNLVLVWYGPFGRAQKRAIRTFINSLNYHGALNLGPQVSSWWQVVESYQSFAKPGPPGPAPPIRVKVVKQMVDKNYSVGKVLTTDFLQALVNQAAPGPNSLVVIFAGRGVTVQGLCTGKCAEHGFFGQQPYVVVGNPEDECPGSCAWPFFPSDYGPKGVILLPPNGNVGADSMVVALASGLAEAVTNPFNDGFYSGIPTRNTEAQGTCPNMFGSGALPGYTGKVLIDPLSGGGFNAHGVRGRKYLLPAIWNPRTNSCYTTL